MPPLTPKFKLSQTETEVLVTVFVPAASSLASFSSTQGDGQGVEIYLSNDNDDDDGNDNNDDITATTTASTLQFYASPCYLLKLNFAPYKFQIPDQSVSPSPPASYNPDDHSICIRLTKATPPPSSSSSSLLAYNWSEFDIGNDDDDNSMSTTSLTSKWIVQSAMDTTLHRQRPIPKQWLHSVVDNEDNEDNNDDKDGDEGNSSDTDDRHGHDDHEVTNCGSDNVLKENGIDRIDTTTTTTNNSSDTHHLESMISDTASHMNSPLPSSQLQPQLPSSQLKLQRTMYGYGFDDMFQRVLTDYCRAGLAHEMLELAKKSNAGEVDTIEHISPLERHSMRLLQEEHDFDIDRYLGDYGLGQDDDEDYMYGLVVEYVPWWNRIKEHGIDGHTRQNDDDSTDIDKVTDELETKLTIDNSNYQNNTNVTTTNSIFTDDEQILLTTIPYPLLPSHVMPSSMNTTTTTNNNKTNKLWCGLLDIVLAYVYDHITTMGDPTVESSWTISILSSRLSWLDNTVQRSSQDDNDEEGGRNNNSLPLKAMIMSTVRSFMRRMLIYPYWRNYKFGMDYVLRNLRKLLKQYRYIGIIKCLLQVRSIMTKSESYYLNNKIWIDPYLRWVQELSKFEQRQHQQEHQREDQQCNNIQTSLIEETVSILDGILDVENEEEEYDDSEKKVPSSLNHSLLKDTLGLDLRRYEAMLEEEDSDSDDTEDSDDTDNNSDDDDESDSDETDSDESEGHESVEGRDKDHNDDDEEDNDNTGIDIDLTSTKGTSDDFTTKLSLETQSVVKPTDNEKRQCLDDLVNMNNDDYDNNIHKTTTSNELFGVNRTEKEGTTCTSATVGDGSTSMRKPLIEELT